MACFGSLGCLERGLAYRSGVTLPLAVFCGARYFPVSNFESSFDKVEKISDHLIT